jgi:2',3'-cyclic-nucleotide 2'-phosphodiesterase (5'-nucleotidase family)
LSLLVALGGFAPLAQAQQAPDATATITILHTNDFHGNLEPAGSNPGMARTAYVINDVRASVGAENVALLDAGDIMQSTLISNLFYGESTIDIYNVMGYQAATFGNHEFDWGQSTLIERTQQATFPFVTANIVVNDTGNCDTAGWTTPDFAEPWMTMMVGAAGNEVKLGIIGITTPETPIITIASATEGLCFKDAANSILHYYDAMKGAGAEVIVVLSHLGYADGGYGYGIPTYGDQTLAKKLNDAGKPANLIIGGHSHTDLSAATVVGNTVVAQAHYAGRKVGRADITVDKATGQVTVNWQRLVVSTSGPEDPDVKAAIAVWANDPWYQSEINRVVGYTAVDITRNYNGDSLMGAFVNDAIYNDLNTDATAENDVDMVFNNPGGLRADILIPAGSPMPFALTHGALYSVLPFGNATIVGDMTGAQIQELLNQSATLFKGALQIAGVRYKFYSYSDALPGPQPWAWGAWDIQVYDRAAGTWGPLQVDETYRIATNEFLAPAGQDGFTPFKYITNTSYWGDMLDGVERWVANTYTTASPYSGALDGRITRVGDSSGGDVVPVTVLHHNDSHGNLYKGQYVGFTQLATLIKQEQAHNPDRNILLNAGDQIQGDAMMAYYKAAPLGYGSDGTALPAELQLHPMMAVMNALDYDAMTLGNHEFNFGNAIFKAVLKQATFPVLQANLEDDGRYGLAEVPVKDYTAVQLSDGAGGTIDVAVLGIGNHRVPNYELPSNIVGLTFSDPIKKAQELAPILQDFNDAVIALTHIGFTIFPGSVEVDAFVDTELAAQTPGVDAIIGGHSHTDPSKQTSASGDYLYLPAFVGGPDNAPVIINHAYRYNNYLGQLVLGMLPKAGGGYEVVARSGRYIKVETSTPEDTALRQMLDPYITFYNNYVNTVIGQTTLPIDALKAYTEETNGANLQADSSVFALAQHGITVDFHLSGAMSNRKVADAATPDAPATLKVQDMFTLMPYENSLVVMRMNGPQLKTVLERAYRNYYYYKYVPNAGGYSYYTTCNLQINKGGQITYWDTYPELPNGNNVLALVFNGHSVDFDDADTYYEVSTVNYLAAGSCNFNDNGVSLWPLSQITHDTQYYVRDVVIDYISAQTAPISPAIEGRIQFGTPTAVQLTEFVADASRFVYADGRRPFLPMLLK